MRETRHLWVGNLPENIREEQVSELFKRYGRVEKVKLSKKTSDNCSSAVVAFVDIRSAQKAQSSAIMSGDRQLQTKYSEPTAMSSVGRHSEQSPLTSRHSVPSSSHRNYSTSHRSDGSRSFEGHSGERGYVGNRYSNHPSSSEHKPLDYTDSRGLQRHRDFRGYDSGSSTSAHQSSKSERKSTKPDLVGTTKKKQKRKIDEQKTSKKSSKQVIKQKERGRSPAIQKKAVITKKKRSHSSSEDEDSSSSSSGSSQHSSSASSASSSVSSSRSNSSASSSSPSSVESEQEREKLVTVIIKKLPSRPSVNSIRDGIYHEFKKCGKVKFVIIRGDNNYRQALVLFRNAAEANKAISHAKTKLLFGAAIEASIYDGEISGKELEECGGIIDEFHPRASRTLFVGNLDKTVGYSDIQNIFVRFGEIVAIEIKKQNNVPQYAFLQYTDIASVVKAFQKMDGERLGQNTLKLGFGKTVMSSCIWVEGVTDSFTEHYLATYFQKYGLVKHIVIDRSLGQALVFYPKYENAQQAISSMRGRKLNGSRLKLDYASHELIELFLSRMRKSGQSVTTFESIRHLLLPPPSVPGAPPHNPSSGGSRNRSGSAYPGGNDGYYDDVHPPRYHGPPHGYESGMPHRGDWRWEERGRRSLYQNVSPRGRRYNDERGEYFHRDEEYYERMPNRYDQDYRSQDYGRRDHGRDYAPLPRGYEDYHRGLKGRDRRDVVHSRVGVPSPARGLPRRSRSTSPRSTTSSGRGRGREFETKGESRMREPRDHSAPQGRSPIRSPSAREGRGSGSDTWSSRKYRETSAQDSPAVYLRKDDERRVELRDSKSQPTSPHHSGSALRSKIIQNSPNPSHGQSWSGSNTQIPEQTKQSLEYSGSWEPIEYDRSRSETPTRDENPELIGEVIIKQPATALTRTIKQDVSKPSENTELTVSSKNKQSSGKSKAKSTSRALGETTDAGSTKMNRKSDSEHHNRATLLQRVHSSSPLSDEHKAKRREESSKSLKKESKSRKTRSSSSDSDGQTLSKKQKFQGIVKVVKNERARGVNEKPHGNISALIKREYSPSQQRVHRVDSQSSDRRVSRSHSSDEQKSYKDLDERISRKNEHYRGNDPHQSFSSHKRCHSDNTKEDSSDSDSSDSSHLKQKHSSNSHEHKSKRVSKEEDVESAKPSKRARRTSLKHEAPMSVASQSFLDDAEEDVVAMAINDEEKEPSSHFRPKMIVKEEIVEIMPESDEESLSVEEAISEEIVLQSDEQEINASKPSDQSSLEVEVTKPAAPIKPKVKIAQPFHTGYLPYSTTSIVAKQDTGEEEKEEKGTDATSESSLEKPTSSKTDKLTKLEEEKSKLQELLVKLDSKKQLGSEEATQVADVFLSEMKQKFQSKRQARKEKELRESKAKNTLDLSGAVNPAESEAVTEISIEEMLEIEPVIEATEIIEEQTIVEEEVTSGDEVVYETLGVEALSEGNEMSGESTHSVHLKEKEPDDLDTRLGYRKQMEAKRKEMEKLKHKEQRSLLRKHKKEREHHKRKVDQMRGPSQNIISSIVDEEDASSDFNSVKKSPTEKQNQVTETSGIANQKSATEASAVNSADQAETDSVNLVNEATKETITKQSPIEAVDETAQDKKPNDVTEHFAGNLKTTTDVKEDIATFIVPTAKDSSTSSNSTPRGTKLDTMSPLMQKAASISDLTKSDEVARQSNKTPITASPYTPKSLPATDRSSHNACRSGSSSLTPSPKLKHPQQRRDSHHSLAKRSSASAKHDPKSQHEKLAAQKRKKMEQSKYAPKHDRHSKSRSSTLPKVFTNLTVTMNTGATEPLGKKELETLRAELESVKSQLDLDMSPGFLSPNSDFDSNLPPISPILKSPMDREASNTPDIGGDSKTYGKSSTSPLFVSSPVVTSPSVSASQASSGFSSLTERMKLLGKVKKKTRSEDRTGVSTVSEEKTKAAKEKEVEFRNSRLFRSSIFDQDSARLSHLSQLSDSSSTTMKPESMYSPYVDTSELPVDKPLFFSLAEKASMLTPFEQVEKIPSVESVSKNVFSLSSNIDIPASAESPIISIAGTNNEGSLSTTGVSIPLVVSSSCDVSPVFSESTQSKISLTNLVKHEDSTVTSDKVKNFEVEKRPDDSIKDQLCVTKESSLPSLVDQNADMSETSVGDLTLVPSSSVDVTLPSLPVNDEEAEMKETISDITNKDVLDDTVVGETQDVQSEIDSSTTTVQTKKEDSPTTFPVKSIENTQMETAQDVEDSNKINFASPEIELVVDKVHNVDVPMSSVHDNIVYDSTDIISTEIVSSDAFDSPVVSNDFGQGIEVDEEVTIGQEKISSEDRDLTESLSLQVSDTANQISETKVLKNEVSGVEENVKSPRVEKENDNSLSLITPAAAKNTGNGKEEKVTSFEQQSEKVGKNVQAVITAVTVKEEVPAVETKASDPKNMSGHFKQKELCKPVKDPEMKEKKLKIEKKFKDDKIDRKDKLKKDKKDHKKFSSSKDMSKSDKTSLKSSTHKSHNEKNTKKLLNKKTDSSFINVEKSKSSIESLPKMKTLETKSGKSVSKSEKSSKFDGSSAKSDIQSSNLLSEKNQTVESKKSKSLEKSDKSKSHEDVTQTSKPPKLSEKKIKSHSSESGRRIKSSNPDQDKKQEIKSNKFSKESKDQKSGQILSKKTKTEECVKDLQNPSLEKMGTLVSKKPVESKHSHPKKEKGKDIAMHHTKSSEKLKLKPKRSKPSSEAEQPIKKKARLDDAKDFSGKKLLSKHKPTIYSSESEDDEKASKESELREVKTKRKPKVSNSSSDTNDDEEDDTLSLKSKKQHVPDSKPHKPIRSVISDDSDSSDNFDDFLNQISRSDDRKKHSHSKDSSAQKLFSSSSDSESDGKEIIKRPKISTKKSEKSSSHKLIKPDSYDSDISDKAFSKKVKSKSIQQSSLSKVKSKDKKVIHSRERSPNHSKKSLTKTVSEKKSAFKVQEKKISKRDPTSESHNKDLKSTAGRISHHTSESDSNESYAEKLTRHDKNTMSNVSKKQLVHKKSKESPLSVADPQIQYKKNKHGTKDEHNSGKKSKVDTSTRQVVRTTSSSSSDDSVDFPPPSPKSSFLTIETIKDETVIPPEYMGQFSSVHTSNTEKDKESFQTIKPQKKSELSSRAIYTSSSSSDSENDYVTPVQEISREDRKTFLDDDLSSSSEDVSDFDIFGKSTQAPWPKPKSEKPDEKVFKQKKLLKHGLTVPKDSSVKKQSKQPCEPLKHPTKSHKQKDIPKHHSKVEKSKQPVHEAKSESKADKKSKPNAEVKSVKEKSDFSMSKMKHDGKSQDHGKVHKKTKHLLEKGKKERIVVASLHGEKHSSDKIKHSSDKASKHDKTSKIHHSEKSSKTDPQELSKNVEKIKHSKDSTEAKHKQRTSLKPKIKDSFNQKRVKEVSSSDTKEPKKSFKPNQDGLKHKKDAKTKNSNLSSKRTNEQKLAVSASDRNEKKRSPRPEKSHEKVTPTEEQSSQDLFLPALQIDESEETNSVRSKSMPGSSFFSDSSENESVQNPMTEQKPTLPITSTSRSFDEPKTMEVQKQKHKKTSHSSSETLSPIRESTHLKSLFSPSRDSSDEEDVAPAQTKPDEDKIAVVSSPSKGKKNKPHSMHRSPSLLKDSKEDQQSSTESMQHGDWPKLESEPSKSDNEGKEGKRKKQHRRRSHDQSPSEKTKHLSSYELFQLEQERRLKQIKEMKKLSQQRDEEAVRSIMSEDDSTEFISPSTCDVDYFGNPVQPGSHDVQSTVEDAKKHNLERMTLITEDNSKDAQMSGSHGSSQQSSKNPSPEPRSTAEEDELAAALRSIESFGDFTVTRKEDHSSQKVAYPGDNVESANISIELQDSSHDVEEDMDKGRDEASYAASTLLKEADASVDSFPTVSPQNKGFCSEDVSKQTSPIQATQQQPIIFPSIRDDYEKVMTSTSSPSPDLQPMKHQPIKSTDQSKADESRASESTLKHEEKLTTKSNIHEQTSAKRFDSNTPEVQVKSNVKLSEQSKPKLTSPRGEETSLAQTQVSENNPQKTVMTSHSTTTKFFEESSVSASFVPPPLSLPTSAFVEMTPPTRPFVSCASLQRESSPTKSHPEEVKMTISSTVDGDAAKLLPGDHTGGETAATAHTVEILTAASVQERSLPASVDSSVRGANTMTHPVGERGEMFVPPAFPQGYCTTIVSQAPQMPKRPSSFLDTNRSHALLQAPTNMTSSAFNFPHSQTAPITQASNVGQQPLFGVSPQTTAGTNNSSFSPLFSYASSVINQSANQHHAINTSKDFQGFSHAQSSLLNPSLPSHQSHHSMPPQASPSSTRTSSLTSPHITTPPATVDYAASKSATPITFQQNIRPGYISPQAVTTTQVSLPHSMTAESRLTPLRHSAPSAGSHALPSQDGSHTRIHSAVAASQSAPAPILSSGKSTQPIPFPPTMGMTRAEYPASPRVAAPVHGRFSMSARMPSHDAKSQQQLQPSPEAAQPQQIPPYNSPMFYPGGIPMLPYGFGHVRPGMPFGRQPYSGFGVQMSLHPSIAAQQQNLPPHSAPTHLYPGQQPGIPFGELRPPVSTNLPHQQAPSQLPKPDKPSQPANSKGRANSSVRTAPTVHSKEFSGVPGHSSQIDPPNPLESHASYAISETMARGQGMSSDAMKLVQQHFQMSGFPTGSQHPKPLSSASASPSIGHPRQTMPGYTQQMYRTPHPDPAAPARMFVPHSSPQLPVDLYQRTPAPPRPQYSAHPGQWPPASVPLQQQVSSQQPSPVHSQPHNPPYFEIPPSVQQADKLSSQRAQQDPSQSSLQDLFERYPVIWQGNLALKNDLAAVQIHYVCGSMSLAQSGLPKQIETSDEHGLAELRIIQRMRMNPVQIDSLQSRMRIDEDFCLLVALPCGRNKEDVIRQTSALSSGFIEYMKQKQVAGIVNVEGVNEATQQRTTFVLHTFPPCDFTMYNLNQRAPDLLANVGDIQHVMIVVTTNTG